MFYICWDDQPLFMGVNAMLVISHIGTRTITQISSMTLPIYEREDTYYVIYRLSLTCFTVCLIDPQVLYWRGIHMFKRFFTTKSVGIVLYRKLSKILSA